jgi:coenzyme F420 hydrogenase subunit beta
MDPELKAKVGLIVSIFCAGTPTTAGTYAILKGLNIEDPAQVASFRYRGHGWPGSATAVLKNPKLNPENPSPAEGPEKSEPVESELREYSMSYDEAWGEILTRHGQLRCRLCPDKTGEFADIALGDPWYRDIKNDIGRSMILLRSQVGKKIWKELQTQPYLKTEPSVSSRLPASQESLYQTRCYLWGRILMMKMWRIPFPIYKGFHLRQNWKQIPLKQKFRTLVGTSVRIVQRHWREPEQIDP